MQKIKHSGLFYEVRIESLEDLWILSQFITPDDIVKSKTERKVKVGGGENQKQVKKIIFVEMNVKKSEFENENLRVQGDIINETEHTAVGQSHSLIFSIDDTLKIEKKKLLKFEKKLIEKSFDNKKTLNALILLDRDELIAVQFGSMSYKVLFEHKGLGSKKYTNEEIDENEQKYKIIKDLVGQKYETYILAGPGSYKESFAKYLKEKEKINVVTYKFPDVSNTAIQKAINEINKSGILKENQLAKESEEVKVLLENINKNSMFAYGLGEVEEKVNQGAAQKILLTTNFISKSREEENYSRVDKILLTAEQQQGDVTILNSKHEPGNIVDGLGGIAAILRY